MLLPGQSQQEHSSTAGDRSEQTGRSEKERIFRRFDAAGVVSGIRRRALVLHGAGAQEGTLQGPNHAQADPGRDSLGVGGNQRTYNTQIANSGEMRMNKLRKYSGGVSRREFLKASSILAGAFAFPTIISARAL